MPRLDRTFKALAEAGPDSLVRLVCDIPWDRHLDIHHIDREMIIPSQPVDHTHEVTDSADEFVLHLEAFAYADHAAADQQIWHATRIAAKLRRAVRSLMILLSPRYPGNHLPLNSISATYTRASTTGASGCGPRIPPKCCRSTGRTCCPGSAR